MISAQILIYQLSNSVFDIINILPLVEGDIINILPLVEGVVEMIVVVALFR
jgi:hypothetical protein